MGGVPNKLYNEKSGYQLACMLFCVQDTVIALQALSAFASLSSTEQINLNITVTTQTASVAKFIIDRTNYLLYQSQEVTIYTHHSKLYTL